MKKITKEQIAKVMVEFFSRMTPEERVEHKRKLEEDRSRNPLDKIDNKRCLDKKEDK